MEIRKILAPIDFSDYSLKTLDYVTDLAKTLGAELVLLHVVEPVYYASPADLYGPSANIAMLMEEQRRMAQQHLDKLAERVREKGVSARTVLASGTAHQTIVDVARKEKTDLIVMATHGRTGLSHVLLGSVAERVVRAATCPVLTVRTDALRRRPASRRAGAGRAKPASRSRHPSRTRT